MPSRSLSAALAGVALVCVAACSRDGRAGPPAASESAPVEVRTALVASAGFERSVHAIGGLEPYERVVVATKVPGRLAQLSADRGDLVRRGQLLAALESREYELRVRAAEAAVGSARALLGLPPEETRDGPAPAAAPDEELDGVADGAAGASDAVEPEGTAVVRLARAELERARLERERAGALAREGVDSQALADSAEADFRAAESRLQEAFELIASRRAQLAQRRSELEIARAQLAETTIEAPFDGRVVARLTATGAFLEPGDALLELVRIDPLRLVLEVSEREAAGVRAGLAVRARVEGRADELTGTVARVSPALSLETRTLVVEVDVPDPRAELRPGAFAQAHIVVAADEPGLAIPPEALTSFAGLDKAFVVRDGKAEERRLVLGRREAGRVEVLSGLAAGEEVVLAPGKLAGGAPVRVQP